MSVAKNRLWYAGLMVLFALGLYLRWPLPSPEWQHVDERAFILHPLGFWSGDLNPHFFNYPTLHFYLASALYYLYYLVGDFESLTSFVAYRYFVDGSDLIGLARGLNSVFSALTGLVCALIARRLYGLWAGLVAGVLFAVLPLSVRFAHLAIVDVPLALWSLAALYFAVRVVEEGRSRDVLWGGVCAGLALAAKYPGILALVPVGLACGLRFGFMRGPVWWSGLVMAVVFVGCSPYVLLDWSSAWMSIKGMGEEHLLGAGHGGGGSALWHHLRYNLRFGIGALGLVGVLLGLFVRWDAYRREEWLVVSGLLAWLVFLAVSSSVFMRYALPLAGLLVLLWVRGLVLLPGPRWRRWLLLLVLAAEPLYGSYQTRALLSAADTRSWARQWIIENMPPGTWLVELGDGSAALQILTPGHVYSCEYRFTDSYDRAALIAAYSSLAVRADLPYLVVDIDPDLALSLQGNRRGWAVISDCDHPLCGEADPTASARLRAQAIWQDDYEIGVSAAATFDLVDWYFIPIGGYGAIYRSGPSLRLGLVPAPSDWQGGEAQDFFALMRDLNKLEQSIAEGDWLGGSLQVEAMQSNPLLKVVVLSKDYIFKYMNYAGLCAFKQGEFAQAINFWEKATKVLTPELSIDNRVLMLNDLGVAYSQEGRYEDALRVWSQSAGLDPHGVDSHYSAAYVLVHNLKRFPAAIQLLERVLVLAPGQVEALFLMAIAHHQVGNLPEALAQYEQLLPLMSGKVDILSNMALVCVEMGDKEQAIELMQRAAALQESAQIYLQLGILCEESGQLEKAQAYLAKVLELEPDHPQAAEIHRLQGLGN